MITPNGLNVKKFSALHEFQNLHAVSKEKLHEFVRGHFYGHYDFDLDKTLYFFIAGRYEFGNKGADIFIEALARLNHYLKSTHPDITVVAFLIFPTRINNFNVESLRGHAVTKSLRDTISDIQNKIGKRMYEVCLSGRLPAGEELLQKEELVRLKRCIFSLQKDGLPPVTTHNIVDDWTDPVLNTIRRCNLFNTTGDRVKVGLDLGIFDCSVWYRLVGGAVVTVACLDLVTIAMCFLLADRVPSRVPQFYQPPVRARLRGVRARLSFGGVPQLLRAVGLHPCRMHGYGYTQCHDKSVRVRVFHAGSHRRSHVVRYIRSR